MFTWYYTEQQRCVKCESLAKMSQRGICRTIYLRTSVCSAIWNFNSATESIINVLEDSGVTPGYFTTKYCIIQDTRVSNSNRKSTDASKVSQQMRHARRNVLLDNDKETEGLTYGAGKF